MKNEDTEFDLLSAIQALEAWCAKEAGRGYTFSRESGIHAGYYGVMLMRNGKGSVRCLEKNPRHAANAALAGEA